MKTKVSIVRCKIYKPEEVRTAVNKAFDLIGGLPLFINAGERVLVKPNILSGSPPQDGVNTHIEIVRAVVRLIKECAAYPVIGDNPGGSVSARAVYESSGILAIAKEEDIECVETRNVKLVQDLPVSSYFFDCDRIISVPKMKTHSLTLITGAIKNMFGAVSGLNKSECHKRFPVPKDFAKILVDVFEIVKPNLVLMDGVIAMDGDGPAGGRLRDVGLLIASQDSVAVDSVFSHLIGMNPYDILTTKEAYKRGLGEIDLRKIEILGEDIEENFIEGFRLPHSKLMLNLPNRLVKILASFVKFGPYIKVGLCKKCRVCAEACPVSVITINDSESKINYRKCIRCMCCHEVCPYRAIELRRNILARLCGL
jgi:uncharacterized protein (DUF362 family)/Pyruvate/2-oxoacid:ferredoxin oxidoreductase delta subunit